jgi:histidine triad (HIT) family protein
MAAAGGHEQQTSDKTTVRAHVPATIACAATALRDLIGALPAAKSAGILLDQMPTACVFCAILRGELPAAMVLRADGVAAFLDQRPLFKGHVLVVPELHVPTLHDLAPAALPAFFGAVQRISAAIVRGLGADGSFVAMNNVVSQSVPHLHAHVVPRHRGDGLRGFFWPRAKYADDAERDDFAARITAAL